MILIIEGLIAFLSGAVPDLCDSICVNLHPGSDGGGQVSHKKKMTTWTKVPNIVIQSD